MKRLLPLIALPLVAGCGSGITSTVTQTVTVRETVAAVGPAPSAEERREARAEKLRAEQAAARRQRAVRRTARRQRAATKARHARYLASLTKRFSGSGGLTLPPFTLPRDSKLAWTNDGGLFQIFGQGTSDAVLVNSQGSKGTTYIDAGRHKLQINAIGNWTIKITPGAK